MSELSSCFLSAVRAHASITLACLVWSAMICIFGTVIWFGSALVGALLSRSSVDIGGSISLVLRYFVLLTLAVALIANFIVVILAASQKFGRGKSFRAFYEKIRERQAQ